MEPQSNKKHFIPGWAVDADNSNEPTHPIKQYTGDDHMRIHWERPRQQKQTVEILKSNERPSLSAVFGSTHPPRGLSGMIRRGAFRYSENLYRHWLPLLMADRINVIEGVIGDIFRGRFPLYWRERGWRALWKFRPWALAGRIAARLIVVAALVMLILYWDRI